MFIIDDPETFWLNVTNIALGVVTLICVVTVAGVVLQEVLQRARKRVAALLPQDDHAFAIPELGITMADGGERLDKPAAMPAPPAPEEEAHIQRSEN